MLCCLGCLILDCGPGLAVVAVGNLEGGDELNGAKVLGSLGDDARDPLGRLQVHLTTGIKPSHAPPCSSNVPHTFLILFTRRWLGDWPSLSGTILRASYWDDKLKMVHRTLS